MEPNRFGVALEALRGMLPDNVLQLDQEARYRASMDNMRYSRMPGAVITPRSEEDIALVLKLANVHRVPLVARGAGTAATGATSPERDGWVLDLSGWTSIEIDPLEAVATVQPGAVVADIDAAAREHGLMFPPDPGSKKFATAGGIIACNAGGLRGAKYGVTRDYVLALRGLLPTGEAVNWGRPLRKQVAGYNLRDLWVGSEGTLGIITRAWFRLIPAPEATHTALAAYGNEADAFDTIDSIIRSRLNPSILEYLDKETTLASLRLHAEKGLPLPTFLEGSEPGALLLFELDGSHRELEEKRQALAELLRPAGSKVSHASNEEEAELLWSVRRRCSQAMFQYGPSKINEDIVVPHRSQRALMGKLAEIRQRYGLPTPTFGHAADGNFHVHLMYDRKDDDQRARAAQGLAELMQAVVDLGGCISGEHGIGLAKSPFLEMQVGSEEKALMSSLKRFFDPHNILNPGKIFEPFEVWDKPREDVHLPWDH